MIILLAYTQYRKLREYVGSGLEECHWLLKYRDAEQPQYTIQSQAVTNFPTHKLGCTCPCWKTGRWSIIQLDSSKSLLRFNFVSSAMTSFFLDPVLYSECPLSISSWTFHGHAQLTNPRHIQGSWTPHSLKKKERKQARHCSTNCFPLRQWHHQPFLWDSSLSLATPWGISFQNPWPVTSTNPHCPNTLCSICDCLATISSSSPLKVILSQRRIFFLVQWRSFSSGGETSAIFEAGS
jgi:hypothetical protein